MFQNARDHGFQRQWDLNLIVVTIGPSEDDHHRLFLRTIKHSGENQPQTG
jgi:hypothetical protein